MKRLAQIAAAAVLAGGIAIFAAPGATAQSIDCSAHVLDATAAQEIKLDVVAAGVDQFKEVIPSADVYVQAYEQIPGGSVDAFWQLGQEQCANWRDESGARVKDNVFVVVYGHDVDDAGFFYGYGFMPAVHSKHDEVMRAVRDHLGPDRSQRNPDYATTALTQPLRSTKVMASQTSSHFYSAANGVYYPPAYGEPEGYEPTDWAQTAKVIGLVAAGFTVAGLVLWLLSVLFRRLGR